MIRVAVQGRTLTTSIKQVYTDFQAAFEKFQKLPYDALNVEAKQFDADFFAFRSSIKELERRLGAIIVQVRGRLSHQLHCCADPCMHSQHPCHLLHDKCALELHCQAELANDRVSNLAECTAPCCSSRW